MKYESDIERALVRAVERAGGMCIKMDGSASLGLPDRLVLLPGGRVQFVELKNGTQGRLSEIQRWRIGQLEKIGFPVEVVRTKEEAEKAATKAATKPV